MIRLTRLHGHEFFLNADLIETVTATPVTTVTLFDGHRFEVAESVETVIERIRHTRATVLRDAEDLRIARPDLVVIHGGSSD